MFACVCAHMCECVQFHAMSALNRHANVPRGHLELSTRPMGKFMFIISPLDDASSGARRKEKNDSHF